MNANTIKFIACVCMLIDHIGAYLFPGVTLLRAIGRISMPLFAFFIGEGCRHTSHRLRYFLRVFVLGALCQAVFTAVEIISGDFNSVYLNILFTFSLSIILCYSWLRLEDSIKSKDNIRITVNAVSFAVLIALAFIFELFCNYSRKLIGITVTLDYGILGVLLPLSAVIFADKKDKFTSFTVASVIFALYRAQFTWYSCLSLLSLPILALYNGKRGSSRFKYGFYVFYPVHLAAIYLTRILFM
ncbi:MAG: hypothetical protein IJ391_03120 [Clostridia bacterium]|nr:hypothetical protein [Clostridia bacterium]